MPRYIFTVEFDGEDKEHAMLAMIQYVSEIKGKIIREIEHRKKFTIEEMELMRYEISSYVEAYTEDEAEEEFKKDIAEHGMSILNFGQGEPIYKKKTKTLHDIIDEDIEDHDDEVTIYALEQLYGKLINPRYTFNKEQLIQLGDKYQLDFNEDNSNKEIMQDLRTSIKDMMLHM